MTIAIGVAMFWIIVISTLTTMAFRKLYHDRFELHKFANEIEGKVYKTLSFYDRSFKTKGMINNFGVSLDVIDPIGDRHPSEFSLILKHKQTFKRIIIRPKSITLNPFSIFGRNEERDYSGEIDPKSLFSCSGHRQAIYDFFDEAPTRIGIVTKLFDLGAQELIVNRKTFIVKGIQLYDSQTLLRLSKTLIKLAEASVD